MVANVPNQTPPPASDDATDLCRQYEAAKMLRRPYEPEWRIITEHVRPQAVHMFNEGSGARSFGSVNRTKSRDSKAAIALERFTAMLSYMLTPEGSRWHGLATTDPALNRKAPVRRFFADLTERLFTHRYVPEAGFAASRYELGNSLGLYGNGTGMTVLPRRIHRALPPRRGLQYRTFALPDTYYIHDADGRVCGVFRRMILSPRQAYQEWPDAAASMPQRVHNAMTSGKAIDTQEHEFFHVVLPRDDFTPDAMDDRRFPWLEAYVAVENKRFMAKSGYRTWPFNLPRGSRVPGELYGRGPAHTSVAAITTANDMKRTLLKQGHRTVDPVVLAHDDGVVGDFSMQPGAINYGAVDSQGRLLVNTMPTGRVDIGQDLLEEERKDISDAFWETLWLILVERPERTATEVLELLREKGALVAPMMALFQAEDLGTLIPREIDLLEQQGLLPELPPELEEADGEFTIVYTSPLAKAMRMEGVTGFMRLSGFAAEAANATGDKRPLRRLNFDAALPGMGDTLSVPPEWLHTDEELERMDEQDQQQAQVQQIADAAPAIAGLAKATGGALPQ